MLKLVGGGGGGDPSAPISLCFSVIFLCKPASVYDYNCNDYTVLA